MKQSEITAEHVAEALALAQRGGFEDEQGAGHLMQARKWSQHVPAYVKRAWLARGLGTYIAALTRWHAELAAAEALDAEGPPERPAPRFKVGDLDPALHETALAATRMLHCGKWPLSLPRVRELPGFDAWNTGPLTSPDWIAQLEALLAEPAAPPAPEVVDVPQPIVKRFGGVEASWGPGEDHVTLVEPARGVGLPAPLALLRAMLADIDAQQRGAS